MEPIFILWIILAVPVSLFTWSIFTVLASVAGVIFKATIKIMELTILFPILVYVILFVMIRKLFKLFLGKKNS